MGFVHLRGFAATVDLIVLVSPQPKVKPLSAKPPRFINESLTGLHATQAAIRAGYSPHTAAQQASRLLRHPRIQEILAQHAEATLRAADLPAGDLVLIGHRPSASETAELTPQQIGRYLRQWRFEPGRFSIPPLANPGSGGSCVDQHRQTAPERGGVSHGVISGVDFDATEDFHSYAIEWSSNQLRWYVDGRLVHRRANWEPTPIPHLPMRFHVNLWPSRSRELAGRIRDRSLPAACALTSVRLAPRSAVGTQTGTP